MDSKGTCIEHFIQECDAYTTAVIHDTAKNKTPKPPPRNMEEYLAQRRTLCGAKSALALIEFGLDMPEEAWSHPVVKALRESTVDMIAILNVRALGC